MEQLTDRDGPAAGRWWALGVLCLSLVVVTIDTTILNVALPSLVRDLHAGSSGLEWIVDAYTVVFAGLLLSAGSLGDRFGRRGALSAGLVVFAVASAASALATTPAQLIGLRALTGAGAALVFPATLSILTNLFPDPVERQRAIAVWAGTAGIGIGLGPVAGGLLLRHFYWGSVFWVNVPICAVALIAGAFLVPSSRDTAKAPLDPPGALLSIVGLSALVYAIIEGPSRGWTSPAVAGVFVVSMSVLAVFAAVELHRRSPMLDLRLFSNPRFTAASLAVTALYFCLFGTIFFQTQHLQFVLGYDPLGAGLRSVPFAVVLLVVANTTPRVVRWAGTRAVITTGLGVVAVSMAMRAGFNVHSGYPAILVSQCVFAFGMGLTIAPATASIMGAVPAGRAGVGSAINDTTRQVGGALGVAVMGSIGASLYRRSATQALAGAHLAPAVSAKVRDSVGSALQVSRSLPAGVARTVNDAARRAFLHGLDISSLVGLGVAVAGSLLAWRFLPAGMTVGAGATSETRTAGIDPTMLALGAEVDR
ncbi:MAG TPA: DHA2 family efflux MFS transporter permease subunit [Acidimicrobiales bacterium]|nr:DHA2 family efflux MFS transporter permease subunit [Acidimicrobiales bacterium]